MTKDEYRKKLLDPRWQRKRLKILERDDWTCQVCSDSENTLHVHHRWYSGDPWEAPDEALITLCADCHEYESSARSGVERLLIDALKRDMYAADVHYLACAVDALGSGMSEIALPVFAKFAFNSAFREAVLKVYQDHMTGVEE